MSVDGVDLLKAGMRTLGRRRIWVTACCIAVALLLAGGALVAAGGAGGSGASAGDVAAAVRVAYSADAGKRADVACHAIPGGASCRIRGQTATVTTSVTFDADGAWHTDSFPDPDGDPHSEFVSGRALTGCCLHRG
jgi:hypothetical protein